MKFLQKLRTWQDNLRKLGFFYFSFMLSFSAMKMSLLFSEYKCIVCGLVWFSKSVQKGMRMSSRAPP